jgi:tripeptide aminopeptidase
MERVLERFLKYVKYDSKSEEDVAEFPSTPGQLVLLGDIAKELNEIGMKDITSDEYGYVFATLPSNIDKDMPVIGLIAHVDTSPEISGKDVNPQIIENYNGLDIVLNREQGITLSTTEFPEIKNYIGQTLITTDGTTLLGADDKAGVAEIITAVEYLISHPEIKHGTIRVGFTPDEEVGRGADFFDVKKFNADFAYTVDGGALGELEYECFSGAKAIMTIKGKSTHPGSAKGVMKNAVSIGVELASMLPQDETPETTEGYQGFYHINDFEGRVDSAVLKYIIRDFDRSELERRKKFITNVVDRLNEKYGAGTVTMELKDQYYNMREKVDQHKHIVDTAFKAMEELNIKPIVTPIRGGTDGARLSFMGLPCPNLFTGGHNYHGRFEYIPVPSMTKSVNVILKIIDMYTNC